MTQCTNGCGIGTSGSSQMSANDLVAAGAPLHANAGEVFSPSALCCFGIGWPAVSVGLVTVSVAGAGCAPARVAVPTTASAARRMCGGLDNVVKNLSENF